MKREQTEKSYKHSLLHINISFVEKSRNDKKKRKKNG